jgi:hypothetical protein
MGGFIGCFKPLYVRWGLCDEGFSDMAAWRRAIELSLGESDVEKLMLIARSRTEPASRVERAHPAGLLGKLVVFSWWAKRSGRTIRRSSAASSHGRTRYDQNIW